MPVHVIRPVDPRLAGEGKALAQCTPEPDRHAAGVVSIGFVNNMADGALEAAERQFAAVLESASAGLEIRLLPFSLPGIPRGPSGALYSGPFCWSLESLREMTLDALIVTGREPLAPDLPDEPYWASFTWLVDWARENTCSAIWSCLAAHAAVLHLDGIRRVRAASKCCGVYACSRASDHKLIRNEQPSVHRPHSRWNGLAEEALADSGYRVLTLAGDAGVDTFIKQVGSLFVFFQGHPEYEADTLALEYRRDVGRYLHGEVPRYPTLPQNYFDETTAAALVRLQQQVATSAPGEVLATLCSVLKQGTPRNTWARSASSLYRNWLESIMLQKQVRQQGRRPAEKLRGLVAAAPLASAPAIGVQPTAP
jgi:homoserine O-succinyltransferase